MNKGKFNLRKNLHSKDLILLQRQQMSKQCKQSARLWPMISFESMKTKFYIDGEWTIYNVLYMLICHIVMLNVVI